jgi:O-antigen/teichoic acid export membrane protein
VLAARTLPARATILMERASPIASRSGDACDPPDGAASSSAARGPGVAASVKHTYGQILKSSALIGGSSAVEIALRIVRTKAMAILLGPGGVGLLGLFGSVSDLAQSVAGMGVSNSGVRQIAQAVGTGDTERIALTVSVLRRTTRVLGVVGAVLLALFSGPVSTLTFGSDEYAGLVALLSVAVVFRLVAAGQHAVIQGMRRIADLARIAMWTALAGTAITIPLVYFLREKGIVPALVATAGTTILSTWWYSRKIGIRAPSMSGAEVREEASALLKLGFAFMVSGLLTMGVAWAVRVIVLRVVGVEAAGFYQAAWAIGGLYAGFILQAMGTDFYPRLTAVAFDDAECTRLVNEQALVSLLLAGPGVLATLTFTPFVIELLYSADFGAAVEALRWICLGMSLRVVTWPMGFVVVARGLQNLFIWIDLACAVVHVGLAWALVRYFGVNGAGMAFLGLYVVHACLVYPIARRLCGFRWSAANRRTGLLFLPLIALVFLGFQVLPFLWATLLGTLAVLAGGIYSLHALVNLVSLDRAPRLVRRALTRLRFVPSERRADDDD